MKFKYLFLVFLITAGLFVAGCGSDDDDDVNDTVTGGPAISGKAAKGAPLSDATVTVYSLTGAAIGTGTTDSNGSFTVNTSATSEMYVVFATDGTDPMLSVTDGTSSVAVTPLTTVVLASLLRPDSPSNADIAASIAARGGSLTVANLEMASQQLFAVLGITTPFDLSDATALVPGDATNPYDVLIDALVLAAGGNLMGGALLNDDDMIFRDDSILSTADLDDVNNALIAAGVTNITVDSSAAIVAPYFTLSDNEVDVGSENRSIETPSSGTATVSGSNPTFLAGNSPAISMEFDNQFSFTSSSATMTLEVSDSGNRKATVTMSVNVSSDGTNTTVTVPAQSNISANVTYADGTTATVTFSNTTPDGPVTSSGNTVTLDPANLRSKIESKLDSISGIVDVDEAGTYTYTVTLSGIPVAHVADDGTYTAFTAVTGSFVVQ